MVVGYNMSRRRIKGLSCLTGEAGVGSIGFLFFWMA